MSKEELWLQMARSEGQAIRCLVIHGLPAWRGKPRLGDKYCISTTVPDSASVQLEQSSSLAPANLPYSAPVGSRYLPHAASRACPVLLNRPSVGWEAAPTSRILLTQCGGAKLHSKDWKGVYYLFFTCI